jgi:hypothetical protein
MEPIPIEDTGLYDNDVVNADLLKKIVPNGSAIETIFAPYIGKMFRKHNPVLRCEISRFNRIFGITSDVLEPIKRILENYKCFIAGGKLIDYVMNKTKEESDNDFDVFFTDEYFGKPIVDSGVDLVSYITNNSFIQIANTGYLTEYAFNNIKLQLIQKSYAEPADILENFDIRACAICTDGKYIYWIKGAIKDIRKKRITIINPKSNLLSMYRISKYINKGFEIKIPDLSFVAIRFLDSLYERNDNKNEIRFDREIEFDRMQHMADYADL